MKCYSTRIGAHYIGGIFITNNGFRRMIPDDQLREVKFGDNLLRLVYSSCLMEISGYRLENIFNDTTMGKLGTLTAAFPSDDPVAAEKTNEPFITSIVYLTMTPETAADLGEEYEQYAQ